MTTTTATISDFRANTKRHVNRLRRTGRAEILTSRGKVQAVVMSAKAYAELTGESAQVRTKRPKWTKAFFESISIDGLERPEQGKTPPLQGW